MRHMLQPNSYLVSSNSQDSEVQTLCILSWSVIILEIPDSWSADRAEGQKQQGSTARLFCVWKTQTEQMGPAPERFELSKGILKSI